MKFTCILTCIHEIYLCTWSLHGGVCTWSLHGDEVHMVYTGMKYMHKSTCSITYVHALNKRSIQASTCSTCSIHAAYRIVSCCLTIDNVIGSSHGSRMDDVSHEFGQPLWVQEEHVPQVVVLKVQQSPCMWLVKEGKGVVMGGVYKGKVCSKRSLGQQWEVRGQWWEVNCEGRSQYC